MRIFVFFHPKYTHKKFKLAVFLSFFLLLIKNNSNLCNIIELHAKFCAMYNKIFTLNPFLLLALTLLFATLNTNSQSLEPPTYADYWQRGNALKFQVISDLGISPLQYSGPGYAFQSGYLYEYDGYNVTINSEIDVAALFTFTDSLQLSSSAFLFSNRFAYTIKKQLPWSIFSTTNFAGISSSIETNLRNYPHLGNSAFSYHFIYSLALSASTERSFNLKKRNYTLKMAFSMPFFANLVRPNYIHLLNFTYPDFDPMNDFSENKKTVTINKFPRFEATFSVLYKAKTGNVFEFFYKFDEYVLKTSQPVYHKTIAVGLLTNIRLK